MAMMGTLRRKSKLKLGPAEASLDLVWSATGTVRLSASASRKSRRG